MKVTVEQSMKASSNPIEVARLPLGFEDQIAEHLDSQGIVIPTSNKVKEKERKELLRLSEEARRRQLELLPKKARWDKYGTGAKVEQEMDSAGYRSRVLLEQARNIH